MLKVRIVHIHTHALEPAKMMDLLDTTIFSCSMCCGILILTARNLPFGFGVDLGNPLDAKRIRSPRLRKDIPTFFGREYGLKLVLCLA